MGALFKVGAVTIAVVVLILIVVAAVGGGGDDEQATAQDREYGHHCLSDWDGNHDGFERLIRDRLNDPDSMETHSTRTSRASAVTGDHDIYMEYSARNALGGRVRTVASGSLNPDTCRVAVTDYGFD